MMAFWCARMWPSSRPSNPASSSSFLSKAAIFSRQLDSFWSDTERLRFRCVNHHDVNQQLIAREFARMDVSLLERSSL